MSLKSSTIKGGLYLTTSNALVHLISFVISIYLANVLLPEDFGLIAIATTYIGLVDVLINIGLGSAIIYNTKASYHQVSTLYWLNYIWAIFVYFLIFITVPYVSQFYTLPELTDIVRLASVSLIVAPIFTTHLKLKERNLKFAFISKIVIVSTLISGIFSVYAAYLGFGVYSLVVRIISAALIKALLFSLFSNWRPIFTFRVRETSKMIWYSFKVKLSQIFLYLERNVDYLILGSFFSPVTIGYYSFAYNIMYTPIKRISYVFGDILFPALSSIKDDKERAVSVLFKSIQLISLVTFPGMTLIALNVDWIIINFFTEKWIEAAPLIKILAFAGAFQSVSQPCGVIFKSLGKPEKLMYISLVRTLMIVVSIIMGAWFDNILIVAKYILISKILSFFLILHQIKELVNYKISSLFLTLIGPSINMVLLISLNHLIFEGFLELGLLKFIMTSIISFVIVIIFHKRLIVDIFSHIRNKF